MRRARLTIAYDGASFHGFAANDGVVTVAGSLTDALSKVSRRAIEIVGAGRTDTGVHAWGQVVSGDLPASTDLAALARRLNGMLGPSLVVRDAQWAPTSEFHARFDARWRHYRYTIVNTPAPNPFMAATAWHVPQPLDIALLQLSCDPFIGEHDFSSFCRKPKRGEDEPPASLARRVLLARWYELGDDVLRFEIRANAFCHQMVRSITGTMVDVGLGKKTPGELMGMIRARDRRAAGQVAPPQGLCLWEVGYDE